MQKSLEVEAKSLEEATENALRRLGVSRDQVEIDVLEDGKVGFLGFGSKSAKIRVTLKEQKTEPSDEERIEEENPGSGENIQACQSTEETVEWDPDLARELLSELIKRMNLEGTIDIDSREGQIYMNIRGKDSNILIGKKGNTLDAIQFLLNLMYSKKKKSKVGIVVDVEEYRLRREKKLQSIALEVFEKVKRTKKPVTIAPMNARDRRIIHVTLQDKQEVRTVSRGEGTFKKVVVVPK